MKKAAYVVGAKLCPLFLEYEELIPEPPNKILIVKTHAIGDVLMVTPAIHAVRQKYPKAHLAMLVGEWSSQLLENNPDIDELIVFDDSILFRPKPIEILKLVRSLRSKEFDMALSFHSSSRMHLLVAFAGAPVRIGLDHHGSGFPLTHTATWQPCSNRYVAENYLDLPNILSCEPQKAKPLITCSEEDHEMASRFLEALGAHRFDTLVAMGPGGGQNPRDCVLEKRWLPEYFAELIREVLAPQGIATLLLGSRSDRPVAQEVCVLSQGSAVFNACGALRLSEVAALIEKCSLLITNDSGLMHVAIAMDTPTVTIFGPTNPASLLPRDPKHRYVRTSLGCSPCYSNSKFPGCGNGGRCMRYVSREAVKSALVAQLEQYLSVAK
ncbi:MAG: lipopolysaccharide heptosyltransferase II [Candidatus Lindowbacteria bacterium]|nr:lipopolysaccharide heptosyltransferase II [Candidatus Lindowbacteria bacterium]